jgi:hypothetical protein
VGEGDVDVSVINHQHEHTVRLEATALERGLSAMPVQDSGDAAVVAALRLVAKRLELVELALREREAS